MFQIIRKTFLYLLPALPVVSNASLPDLLVKDFSASYQDGDGAAKAKNFRYEDLSFGENPEFEIFQQAGEFVLKGEGEEFRFSSLPNAVMNWQQLAVERLDLETRNGFIDVDSGRIDYVNQYGKEGYISGIDATCETTDKNAVAQAALDLCLNQKMTFYLPFIGGVSVNNINIWVTNNKLNFSLKNKVWIKGYGAAFYDAEKQMVRIRVDKAKAGFFNVTGKFFSEVKSMENRFVKVDRPWIEISIPGEL